MTNKLKLIIAASIFLMTAQSMGGEMITAEEIIKKLDLKPLPEEGGYFRETYRSNYGRNTATTFGTGGNSERDLNTAIYYLISEGSFSAIHRITSDEIFHFYAGDSVEMIQIDEQGDFTRYILGSDVLKGEVPQVVVPRGTWQALRLVDGGRWSLMGTTVAPGFEFEDFEIGTRNQMLETFPQHREDIIRFTRDENEKAH